MVLHSFVLNEVAARYGEGRVPSGVGHVIHDPSGVNEMMDGALLDGFRAAFSRRGNSIYRRFHSRNDKVGVSRLALSYRAVFVRSTPPAFSL